MNVKKLSEKINEAIDELEATIAACSISPTTDALEMLMLLREIDDDINSK